MITQKYLDELTYEVIGSAIEVYKTMGRGLLESLYHQCLKEELLYRKINFVSELKIPVIYKTKELEIDFKCDLFLENCLVVELKAVNRMEALFEAQLLTYMKLLKAPKGIIINFNCSKMGKKHLLMNISMFFQNFNFIF